MNDSPGPSSVVSRARLAVVGVTAALLLVVLASAASAAESAGGTDAFRFVLSGTVDVSAGETVGDVVIMHGSATVDGTVDGSVVVLDGPVSVTGEVMQDVVVLNGAVVIADGARIGHDVVSPRSPQVAEGATVDGGVRRARTDWGLRSLTVSWFWSWFAVTFSTLALGLLLVLLAPHAADAGRTVLQTRPGLVAGAVAIVAVALPVVAVLALVTVVGIPFGAGLLLPVPLLYAVGYVGFAWLAGRIIRPRPASQLASFVVGWAIVRAVALVPFLDGLLWFPGAAFGLGVLVAAAWNAGQPSAAPTHRSVPPVGAHP
jgi:hypothetical protein